MYPHIVFHKTVYDSVYVYNSLDCIKCNMHQLLYDNISFV